MPRSSAQVYETVSKQSLEGRELEATVLLKAARKLRTCSQHWEEVERSADLQALDDALRYNQKLWTIFQAELSDPASPLPRDLRRNLLLLSVYIDKTTFQILASPEKSKLDTLVRINTNIAEGLMQNAAPAGAATPQPDTLEGLDVTF